MKTTNRVSNFYESGTDGRVYLLSKLGEKFTLHYEQGDKGSFFVDVQVPGIKEKVQVKISFITLAGQYAVLSEGKITYSSVNLGQTRLTALDNQLCEILYSDDTLFLSQLETDVAYVYGEHAVANTGISFNLTAYYVRKVPSSALELLIEDKLQGDQYKRSKGKEDRSIFYYDGMLLIRQLNNRTKEMELALKSGNLQAFFRNIYSSNLVVDDNLQVYETVPVFDPDNIRLLTLDKGDELYRVKVKSVFNTNYSGYTRGFTYSEAYAQITELYENANHDLDAFPVLPIFGEDVAIYSKRIIGKEVKRYEPGQWVELIDDRDDRGNRSPKKGAYGQVIEQEGTLLRIVWEHQYTNIYDSVTYYQVKPIECPLTVYRNPLFVRFRHFRHPDNGDLFVGYGKVAKSTPRYSLVVPICHFPDQVIDAFLSKAEKEDSLSYYSMSEPFLLVPNDSVFTGLDAEVKGFVLTEAYDERYHTFRKLSALLLSGSAVDCNAGMFATRLSLLSDKIGYEAVVTKLSDFMLRAKERSGYSYKVITTPDFEAFLESLESEHFNPGMAICSDEQKIAEALKIQLGFLDPFFVDVSEEGDYIFCSLMGDPQVEYQKFQISVAYESGHDTAAVQYSLLDVPGTHPVYTGELSL
ncbi:hypothetical protein [Paenibacillus sp. Y412MC10]|uniref:hypothetical protein n=1 Tax=Geobacillus sp. (strain Y412MC10) TaxID=481743 RepID=UPI0011AB6DD1|nr:hypothetical protein [Paenibacillus sp. Y412MC10]